MSRFLRIPLSRPLVLGLPFIGLSLMAAPAGARDLPEFSALVRQHEAEVVNISTTYQAEPASGNTDESLNDGLGTSPPVDGTSLGSGVIVSGDGYIITCAHVVERASEIVVRLSDRREYRAQLIGADARSDVALLKIGATGLRAATIGDPGKLVVGDWVLAIGAPFGFESSATSGILSAKGRNLPSENYVTFLQTDVAINPGNSGGPLFNLKGEVVGINSQIYSRTGTFTGLSFAIPVDIAIQIAEQLKRHGAVRRGWLGVRLQEVNSRLASAYGLDRPRGALIADILPNGPAARSELKSGDIVLEYEGRSVQISSELPPLVGMTAPGKDARVRLFRRDRGVINTLVKIGELRDSGLAARAAAPTKVAARSTLGLALAELTATQRKNYNVTGGVVVDEIQEGPAREAGLRIGDVIVEVDGRAVSGVSGFYRVLAQAKPGQHAVLRVRRGTSAMYLALTP